MAGEHGVLGGRRALVTGAGKRIGRATALELAAAGADVVVHVNRSMDEGREVVEEIRAMGRRSVLLQADQSDVAAIRRACDEAVEAMGGIDILVNNAAIWPEAVLDETTEEDFDLAINANLKGPFFWARYLGPPMKKAGWGVIVSLADVNTDRPSPRHLPYCIAKAGILAMTYGLAKALGPEVRVNAIGPGPMIFPDDYPEWKKDADREATLLGREGCGEDIARAVRFLCEHDYITGVLLPVDGGMRFKT